MTHAKPRILFLLSGEPANPDRPRVSALTAEVAAGLERRGASVDFLTPGAVEIARLRPAHDLYVLKEKTPFNLSVAQVLALAGARVVNTARASAQARDKIAATALIAAAGVPVPPSWTAGTAERFAPLAKDGALWLKPQRGSRGFGVRRIGRDGNPGASRALDAFGLPLPLFAQREAPSDGTDLKLYVIGERVWALRRPYPASTPEDKLGRAVEPAPEFVAAALACGRALGLELYGVDFLVSGDSYSVVDVNAFPGYKGAAAAPEALADYLFNCVRGARTEAAEASL